MQAINPESGTISYGYDNRNNLATSKDLVRTLTFGAYDGMNRVTSKSYSDSITSQVNFTYDGTQKSCNGAREVGVCDGGQFRNNYTCYDTMGRIEKSSQVVGSTTYPFSYTYDISGALATETYPSGRVVTNAFDAAGRISGVTGSIAPSAYASNVTYAPQGPISGLNLGSGMTEAWTFSSREQPITLKVNTTGLPLNLGWGYGAAANNNGNVQSQTISGPGLGGLTLTQNYTYDAVNRLWTFAETGSTANQNYNYDSFGNRWLTSSWIAPGMSGQTPITNAFTNNRWGLNGVNGYDGAGNQTSIAGAYRTFSYDGENRQIMAVIGNPSTATTYNYDGEGRRVQKITSSGTTTYVYDAMGHLAAEYGGSSTSAGRVYLSVDALGSTRLVTDASGNPTEQYDYAPFGEELTQGIDGRVAPYSTNQYPTTPDAVTEKFTSKERDAESGLDYFGARYYSSAQGRFSSPDEFKGDIVDIMTGQNIETDQALPFGDIEDPQTLNKYVYVRDNPMRYIDPDGHDFWDYVKGAVNAFASDNSFGAGRMDVDNGDFRKGQAIGDAVATVTGTAEGLFGGGAAVVTSPAALTVAGAVIPAAAGAIACAWSLHRNRRRWPSSKCGVLKLERAWRQAGKTKSNRKG